MRGSAIALLALVAVLAVAEAADVHAKARIDSELSPSSATAVARSGAADVTVGPVTIITEPARGAAVSVSQPSASGPALPGSRIQNSAGLRPVPQSSASTLSSALLHSPLSLPTLQSTSQSSQAASTSAFASTLASLQRALSSTRHSGSSAQSSPQSVLRSASLSAAAAGSQHDATGIMCMWDGVPLRCKGVTKGVCCVKTKTCCKHGYRCDPHGQGKCIRTPTIVIKPVIVINQPDCCGQDGAKRKTAPVHSGALPPPPLPPVLTSNVRSVPAIQPHPSAPTASDQQEDNGSDDGEDSNGKKDDDGVVMNLTNVNTINKRCTGDQTPGKDKCSDGSIPNLDSGDLDVAGQQPEPHPASTS